MRTDLVESRPVKRRKIKDDRKPGPKIQIEVRSGHVVAKKTDLYRLQRFHSVAPRGWCKKYWWDDRLPNYEVETGGRITLYTPVHLSEIEQLNQSLGVALADEQKLYCPSLKKDEKSQEMQVSTCIPLRYQVLKDIIHYYPETHRYYPKINLYTTLEFKKLGEALKYDGTSVQESTDSLNDVVSEPRNYKQIHPWERHRLLDIALYREFQSQIRLRQLGRQRLSSLMSTFEIWDNVFDCWVQRDPDQGYGIPVRFHA